MTSIVVVGSINLDVACSCERFPGPGETVPGDRIAYGRGGKGANQAAAAARAGAATTFIGAVGDDGARVLDSLGDVDLRVTRVPGPTGTAVITVDGRGENTIVVVPGANALLSLTDDDRRVVADADVLLMQSEVPVPVVLDAARAARAGGTTVILNPSPVRDLPDELWSLVDVVVVNESEASASASHLARIPTVVTTFGANGAALRSPDGSSAWTGSRSTSSTPPARATRSPGRSPRRGTSRPPNDWRVRTLRAHGPRPSRVRERVSSPVRPPTRRCRGRRTCRVRSALPGLGRSAFVAISVSSATSPLLSAQTVNFRFSRWRAADASGQAGITCQACTASSS